MAITVSDVKLLKSEVLLDTTDGGGAMTGYEVVDGLSNNLFPDISELDRAYGRISLRKAFAGVLTTTTDSYYGAHVIITEKPEDPKVNVSIFSTKDWFDMRAKAKSRVEEYLAPGVKWGGHLAEVQLEGARALQMCLQLADPLPSVGRTLYLVENEGKSTQYFQYVRVSKVVSVERQFTEEDGTTWIGLLVTVSITDALRYTFHGIAPTKRSNKIALSPACVRDTIVADSAKYYGIADLTRAAAIGDLTVKVDGIYTQLVPSAQSEIALVDLNAGGQANPLYKSGAPITLNYGGLNVTSTYKHFTGNPILPGSLTVTVSGTTYTDSKGELVSASNTSIAVIDYGAGIISFSNTGTLTQIVFTPAAAPIRITRTALMQIVENERGYVYAYTMVPPPPPCGLSVSYCTQGKWYELRDVGPVNGVGALKGSDSAYGSGTVNYVTGTAIITLGALPDMDSPIMFSWATPATYCDRTDVAPATPYIQLIVANPKVIPGTVTVSWPDPSNGATISVSDDGHGVFSNAHATGTIEYPSGLIKLAPTRVPLGGSQFTVDYSWGEKYEESFEQQAPEGDGMVHFTLSHQNIVPGTLQVSWAIIASKSFDNITRSISSGGSSGGNMGGGSAQSSYSLTHSVATHRTRAVRRASDNKDGKLYVPGTLTPQANSAINYVDGLLAFKPTEGTFKIQCPVYATEVTSTSSSVSWG